MENGMNVLSLFDGMSCGRIALERVGIEIENYFASEIDPWAIKVSKANYSDIKHIGSVTDVKAENLPKIDLLIGGSPCQGFSFAGKKLNFEDPRSKLFFEYVRLLKECKPKYFLLENVVMKKEFQDVISKEIGVEPTLINSALVSAQNRKRLYWTNIPGIIQPEDKGILLKDIIENNFVVDREKSFCLDANYFKGGNPEQYFSKSRRQLVFYENTKDGTLETNVYVEKSQCLLATIHKENPKSMLKRGKKGFLVSQNMELRQFQESRKSTTLTTMGGGHREPKILLVPRGNNPGGLRSENGKVGTLTSNSWEQNNFLTQNNGFSWRKLTPLECERLQTVPDNYTACVSNTQRYRMIGNGWTVDVIAHILKQIKTIHN